MDDKPRTGILSKFGPYNKLESNVIYLFYISVGGFLWDKKCNPHLRNVLFGLNIFTVVFFIANGILFTYELHKTREFTIRNVVNTLIAYTLGMIACVVILQAYIARKDILRTIDLIEADFNISFKTNEAGEEPEKVFCKTIDANLYTLVAFCLTMFCTIVQCTGRHLGGLAMGSEDIFADVAYYNTPIPYVHKIDSYWKFNFINIVLTIVQIPLCLGGSVLPTLILSMGAQYYNAVIRLSFNMQLDTMSTVKEIESMDQMKFSITDETHIDALRPKEDNVVAAFCKRWTDFLVEYRYLRAEAMKNLTYITTILFLVDISLLVTLNMLIIVFLFGPETPFVEKAPYVIGLFVLVVILFSCCYTAKLMTDAVDSMIFAIYDSAWPYMPRQARRFIYQFLAEVQHEPITFVLFLYPVNMAAFVGTMRFNYTIINTAKFFRNPNA